MATGSPSTDLEGRVLIIRVSYAEGEPENYLLFVAIASGQAAERVQNELPQAVMARLENQRAGAGAVLYEALADKAFSAMLLDVIRRRRRLKGAAGDTVAATTPEFRRIAGRDSGLLEPW